MSKREEKKAKFAEEPKSSKSSALIMIAVIIATVAAASFWFMAGPADASKYLKAENGKVSVPLADVSDGLAADIRQLMCRSGVGAVIQEKAVPIAAAAANASDSRTPIEHALFDGEDYELLFTVDSSNVDRFTSEWAEQFDLPATAVGLITDRPGCLQLLNAGETLVDIVQDGYEHFREQGAVDQ